MDNDDEYLFIFDAVDASKCGGMHAHVHDKSWQCQSHMTTYDNFQYDIHSEQDKV